jgi:hypothetical protein
MSFFTIQLRIPNYFLVSNRDCFTFHICNAHCDCVNDALCGSNGDKHHFLHPNPISSVRDTNWVDSEHLPSRAQRNGNGLAHSHCYTHSINRRDSVHNHDGDYI